MTTDIRALFCTSTLSKAKLVKKHLLLLFLFSFFFASASAAPTCDAFRGAMIDGAEQYGMTRLSFRMTGSKSSDQSETYWSVASFDDVHTVMICRHGTIRAFSINTHVGIVSSTHLLLLTGLSLHAFGMNWVDARSLRDDMVSVAIRSDRGIAGATLDGGMASFVISAAGPRVFEITAPEAEMVPENSN